jgi:clan AA aspartic protease
MVAEKTMIAGHVIEGVEPVVPLTIIDGRGREWEFDAVVDTGFTAELTLPPSAIELMELEEIRTDPARVADERIIYRSVYRANLLWEGQIRQVDVVELDREPLAGMTLLKDHRLTIDVTDGGRVEITPLTTDH